MTESDLHITETCCHVLQPGCEYSSLMIWQGRPVYSSHDKKGVRLVWGDWMSKKFKYINDIVFPLDRPTMMFTAFRGQKSFLVDGWREHELPSAASHAAMIDVSLVYVLQKYDGPPDTMRVVRADKEFRPYTFCWNLVSDGQKIWYIAATADYCCVVSEETEGKRYNSCECLQVLDGKPLYLAREAAKKELIVWGEEEIYSCSKIYSTSGIRVFDGKPLFVAKRDGQRYVVWGEKEFSTPDDHFDELTIADGKPLYVAAYDKPNTPRSILVWGTEILANENVLTHIYVVDGKPLCTVIDQDRTCYVRWGERRFMTDYERIVDMTWDKENRTLRVYGLRKEKLYEAKVVLPV